MKLRVTSVLATLAFVCLNGCGSGTDEPAPPLQTAIDFNVASTDWLYGLFGIDSGFEAFSGIYYQAIVVTASR